MPPRFIIYGLVDPRDGQLRYVGKTEGSLSVRLNHHVYRALNQTTNTHKRAWLRSVLASGVRPEVMVLEECETSEALSEAEIWHIAYWRFLGAALTNGTAGGEGARGYRHSPEVRARMSALKTGHTHKGKPHKLTEMQELEVIALYRQGRSCAYLEKFGMSGGGIRKMLLRHGVRLRNAAEQRWMTRSLEAG